MCIIRYTSVELQTWEEVSAEFAAAEGEGDLTLEWWRDAHRRYFTRTLPKIGREFSPGMPLCCERFQVVHRAGEHAS